MSETRDHIKLSPSWVIIKRWVATGEVYAVENIIGNLALNGGIAVLWDLIGATDGGTAGLFDEANAELGIGDSDTTASASQTDLQAPSNKTWIAMDSGYPQRTDQTIIWQATAGTTDCNYAWKEFAVRNGDGTLLNRRVDSRGTKDSSMEWTVQLKIVAS